MATVSLWYKRPGDSNFFEATAADITGDYGSVNPGSHHELLWDPVNDMRDLDGSTVELQLRVEF